jgi:hypothetical protein
MVVPGRRWWCRDGDSGAGAAIVVPGRRYRRMGSDDEGDDDGDRNGNRRRRWCAHADRPRHTVREPIENRE